MTDAPDAAVPVITILKFLVVGIYAACPFLLLRLSRRWGAIAAIIALWIPIEFSLFTRIGLPQATGIVAGMLSGVLAFRNRPEVINVSAAFDIRKLSFRGGFLYFAGFVVVGLPIAWGIGFIHWAGRWPDLAAIPWLIGGIFFLNALPEEILFRGMVQHSVESATGSRIVSLIVGALIFGLTHLNNGAVVPNYRYFVLATLAGIFYGLAWRENRNVLTSSITHTLVNSAWRLFFR